MEEFAGEGPEIVERILRAAMSERQLNEVLVDFWFNHFNVYAPQFNPVEALKYGQDRYSNEVNRLFGVLNKRLADREFVAGAISIADFAIWPWLVSFKNFRQNMDDFPNLKRYFEKSMGERPAVKKGRVVGAELRATPGINTDEQRRILFGQTASVVR